MTQIYIDSWNEGFGHLLYLATGWRPPGISRADGTEVAFGRPT